MKNNNTRDQIIRVATRLFHLQGYHATGLNQILKESGTPKGSLYYYFPGGKEQLVIEVIKFSSQLVEEEITQYLMAVENPILAIQQQMDVIIARFENIENPDFLKLPPFALIALETAFANETIREVCVETYSKWEHLYFSKFVKSGMEETVAMDLAITVNAAIEGALTLSITKKSNEPLRIIKKMIPKFFT